MPQTNTHNHELGRKIESLVASLYEQKGFRLVAKNFQRYKTGTQGRQGEIDLVLEKDKMLIFVEVKARLNQKFGPSASQITRKQLQNLFYTMQYFLLKNPSYQNYQKRFDAAFYDHPKLNIIPNAYSFDDLSSPC